VRTKLKPKNQTFHVAFVEMELSTTKQTPTNQPINRSTNLIGDKPSAQRGNEQEKEKQTWSSPVTMTSNPSQWICILKLGNATLLILLKTGFLVSGNRKKQSDLRACLNSSTVDHTARRRSATRRGSESDCTEIFFL
jgi:hypothetical protein